MTSATVAHRPPAARPPLSPAQMRLLLREIAASASTVRNIAARTVPELGRTPQADDVHAIRMLVERIGALADFGIGGETFGGIADWSCHGFDDEGGRP